MWLVVTRPHPNGDPGPEERPPPQHIGEPRPMQTRALASTAKPRVPGPLRCSDESHHTARVTMHAEGVEVTSSAPIERGVWSLDRRMPMATAPVVKRRFHPSEAGPPCLAPHPPGTFTGSRPIERAPQKVTGGRTCTALLRLWRTPKGHQPRFVRVQGQSEAPQPLATPRLYATRIVLTLTADDAVNPMDAFGSHE